MACSVPFIVGHGALKSANVCGRSGFALSVDLLLSRDHRRLPPVVHFVLISKPAQTLPWSLKTSNILQARTPLCLEYTGALDLMGRPVIEDGLA